MKNRQRIVRVLVVSLIGCFTMIQPASANVRVWNQNNELIEFKGSKKNKQQKASKPSKASKSHKAVKPHKKQKQVKKVVKNKKVKPYKPYKQHRPHKKPIKRYQTYRRRYNPYPFGRMYLNLPFGFLRLSIGGRRVYYNDGIYYQYRDRRYVAVSAPIGVRIPYLPYGYEILNVNGRNYYHHRGVYYVHSASGYLVVSEPVERATEVVYVDSPREQTSSLVDTIELNIPNNSGGYNAVLLKRQGEGFVGPQGEYYNEFPTVGELQVIYGELRS